MSNIVWLMAANVAFWLGIAAYVCFLAKTQQGLEKRLQMKESIDHE